MTDTMTRPPDVSAPPAAAGVTRRRRQTPWIALGVLLMAGSILGFALWSAAQSTRTPVLVAAHDIDAGSILVESDLAVASIAADADVALLGRIG